MDIRMKVASLLFDFDSLNEEAQEELSNGKDVEDVQQPDNEVSADTTA